MKRSVSATSRREPRYLFLVALLTAAAGCTETISPPPEDDVPDPGGPNPTPLMIVTLEPKTDARAVAREHGINPPFVYSHVMSGFAGSISEAARAGLMRDNRVVRVDRDEEYYIEGGTQSPATWGLDRIDQREGTLDNRYVFEATGKGVTIYILDTGIRYSHAEFGGRAVPGFDAFGGDGSDCHSHGTHVAGTSGGAVYGIAREAKLVSVRVIGCNGYGTTSSVVAGLDWIASQAARPAVVNMSIAGSGDRVMDEAIGRAINAGITVVAAAGNANSDACNYSPARVPEVITVGAIDQGDRRASYSNWGGCVDAFAPGTAVYAASYSSDGGIRVMSGTSMAAPHAAGTAALYLERVPAASPGTVANALASWATRGIVADARSANADLLYALGPIENDGNQAPRPAFTAQCTQNTCNFSDASSDPDGSIVRWAWNFGDGSTSAAVSPSRTYAAPGTYYVSLTVTDDDGAAATDRRSVSVALPGSNTPPVAAFQHSCSDVTCTFTDSSTDPDGSLTGWEWNFGDGTAAVTQSGSTQTHTFAAGGVFNVSLSVTDNAGARTSTTRTVEAGLVLRAVGYRLRGRETVDLQWRGATTNTVSLFMDDVLVASPRNTGQYAYTVGRTSKSSHTFRLCDAGTNRCSLPQAVSF